MTDILKKYPLPWKIVESLHGESVMSANGEVVIKEHKHLYISDLLEAINNFARPRITDTFCDCDCGWTGTVGNCLPDIDGDGGLGCPRCLVTIEVVA